MAQGERRPGFVGLEQPGACEDLRALGVDVEPQQVALVAETEEVPVGDEQRSLADAHRDLSLPRAIDDGFVPIQVGAGQFLPGGDVEADDGARMIRYAVDLEANPWGLALDGFGGEGPRRLSEAQLSDTDHVSVRSQ